MITTAVRRRRSPLPLALLLVPAAGCSIEKMAADQMVPILGRTREHFHRETVPRYGREAAPALLATLDGIALTSPDNPELRLLQAEMHATFAFAFLEQEDPVWATAEYRKARTAALAALADEDEDLAATLAGGSADATARALAEADEDALPGLFWWAFARGAEINLHRGDPAQVADLDRVDRVMGWVVERDPDYYYGGPHLYFAMRHVALPASLGGDPAEGLKHFEAVERITKGRHLMAKVLRAQHHAPSLAATPAGAPLAEVLAAQRRAWEAWYGALAAVAEAPDDLWPEQALANAVARERARALLRDPEANNIIPPEGAENPYAASGDGWSEDDAWDDAGAWDDGD